MTLPANVVEAPDELLRIFTQSQRRLEAEYARILTEPLAVHRRNRIKELRATLAVEIGRLESSSANWLERQVPAIYQQGAIATGLTGGGFQFTQFHRGAVRSIVTDTYSEVLQATSFMDDDAKRWMRQVSRELSATQYLEGRTPKQVARDLAKFAPKQFKDQTGLPLPPGNVQYRNGSYRSMDSYAEMLFRTKSGNTYNLGMVETSLTYGVTRFECADGADCGLTSHDDPKKANGLIVSARTATDWPLSHPNCRRSFRPRPDLTPRNETEALQGYGLGEYLSSETPEIQAQRAAREVRDRATRQARTKRRQQSPAGQAQTRARRKSRAAQQQAQAAADKAAKDAAASAVKAETAARKAAERKVRTTAASREAARKRVTEARGPLLQREGISADEYILARAQAKELRRELRAIAKEIDLTESDLWPKVYLPSKFKNHKNPVTGAKRRVRVAHDGEPLGGEYDWANALSPAETRQLRRRRLTSKVTEGEPEGLAPDEAAARWARDFGTDDTWQVDEAMEFWRAEAHRLDAARSLGAGNRVNKWGNADEVYRGTQIGAEMRERGVDISHLVGGTEEEAIAHLAKADQTTRLRYAETILERRTNGPRPWEIAPEDYAAEVAAITENPATAAAVARWEDGEILDDASEYLVSRWLELRPDGLGLDDLSHGEAYDTVRHFAQQAGYVEDGLDPAAAAQALRDSRDPEAVAERIRIAINSQPSDPVAEAVAETRRSAVLDF